jgi:hypothetical protein
MGFKGRTLSKMRAVSSQSLRIQEQDIFCSWMRSGCACDASEAWKKAEAEAERGSDVE